MSEGILIKKTEQPTAHWRCPWCLEEGPAGTDDWICCSRDATSVHRTCARDFGTCPICQQQLFEKELLRSANLVDPSASSLRPRINVRIRTFPRAAILAASRLSERLDEFQRRLAKANAWTSSRAFRGTLALGFALISCGAILSGSLPSSAFIWLIPLSAGISLSIRKLWAESDIAYRPHRRSQGSREQRLRNEIRALDRSALELFHRFALTKSSIESSLVLFDRRTEAAREFERRERERILQRELSAIESRTTLSEATQAEGLGRDTLTRLEAHGFRFARDLHRETELAQAVGLEIADRLQVWRALLADAFRRLRAPIDASLLKSPLIEDALDEQKRYLGELVRRTEAIKSQLESIQEQRSLLSRELESFVRP
jgi:hypothetical protein